MDSNSRQNGNPLRSSAGGPERLRKELGLRDVYAISTGAMFSSGFFLLPGLAAAQTGPSVSLAYLVAAVFILPAMFSVAELSTAMPRAGGAYYFLDRSMGPMVGTVGGLGTWIALVFKSAFALVGMGAYLAIYVDIPIRPLAVGLTAGFAILNIVGAKETSGLQRVLVGALLVILAFFLVQGLAEVGSRGMGFVLGDQFGDFFAFGLTGFISTIGFVFVSYAGLTKVASVSEEIRDPDRNIPLGMILSLATATVVYTVGVFIMVAVLPPEELRADLTPVATAAAAFFDWLPGGIGVVLIVVAAIAAFASTGNAGILSASRYPLAMARDHIVSPRFGVLGRFRTPTRAILATALFMALAIVALDIESIAKLASAFQLLLFSLLCLAVVIMRESEIEGYDPGYRSPLYPFMQIFGFLAPLWLIAEMGRLAVLFTFALVAVTIGWYFYYARARVERSGAIFHTFARLGAFRHSGLDRELREIVWEKGLREEDPYDEVVARAPVLDFERPVIFGGVAREAAAQLGEVTDLPVEEVLRGMRRAREEGLVPMGDRVTLLHWRQSGLTRPAMVLVRLRGGLEGNGGPSADGTEAEADSTEAGADGADERAEGAGERVGGTEEQAGETEERAARTEARADGTEEGAGDAETPSWERIDGPDLRGMIVLLSRHEDPGMHLRLLGHLATQVDDPDFIGAWMAAPDTNALRATLMREERTLFLRVGRDGVAGGWAGLQLSDLDLPPETLVALVRRGKDVIVPGGSTVLREGDRLTLIGASEGIAALTARQGAEQEVAGQPRAPQAGP